jgi:hypothetical protein
MAFERPEAAVHKEPLRIRVGRSRRIMPVHQRDVPVHYLERRSEFRR